jgi:Family of unknown function (DUF6734)
VIGHDLVRHIRKETEQVRAVWSFWSKPFYEGTGWSWREPVHHLLAWGLSLRLARSHYPETVLITDSPGKALLVDGLGLPFTQVSTELDRLRNEHSGWWALGKLVAYSLQDRPFVHLDTDVFLWRPLPDRVISAPVLAQYPEHYHRADQWCGPRIIEDAFARHSLSLPAEWEWSRSHQARRFREANCGILGGQSAAFIQHYAQQALDLVLNPRHSAAWASIPGRAGLNTIVEQFFLLACLDFHRFDPASPFRGVCIKYLFPSLDAAFDPACAARLGLTHLLAEAKMDADITSRLEQRIQREDPDFYRHCVSLSRGARPLPGTRQIAHF